jgi:hypothetical protein
MPIRIPNDTYTVKKMKAYIRTHKLNRPDVKLGMKRHGLINGLKKAGHWDTTFSSKARKPVARMGRPTKPKKPPARKRKKKRTAQESQLDVAANLLGLDPQRDIVVI